MSGQIKLKDSAAPKARVGREDFPNEETENDDKEKKEKRKAHGPQHNADQTEGAKISGSSLKSRRVFALNAGFPHTLSLAWR